MTSKRQVEAETRWRDRVGDRLAAATTSKARAQVWWDELRRRADDKNLPAEIRDDMYRAATEGIRAAITQRGRQ